MANELHTLHGNFLNKFGLNEPVGFDVTNLEEYKEALGEGYKTFVEMIHNILPTFVPHKWMMENLCEYREALENYEISIPPEVEEKAREIETKFVGHCLDNAASACKKTYALKDIQKAPGEDTRRDNFFGTANEYGEFEKFVSDVVFYFNNLDSEQRYDDMLLFKTANASPEHRESLSSWLRAHASNELEEADKILRVIGPLYRSNEDKFFKLKRLLAQVHGYHPSSIPSEAREILKEYFIEKELRKAVKESEDDVVEYMGLAGRYPGIMGSFFSGC